MSARIILPTLTQARPEIQAPPMWSLSRVSPPVSRRMASELPRLRLSCPPRRKRTQRSATAVAAAGRQLLEILQRIGPRRTTLPLAIILLPTPCLKTSATAVLRRGRRMTVHSSEQRPEVRRNQPVCVFLQPGRRHAGRSFSPVRCVSIRSFAGNVGLACTLYSSSSRVRIRYTLPVSLRKETTRESVRSR